MVRSKTPSWEINDADNQKIHREIVTGIVQVVRFTHKVSQMGTVEFNVVWRIGTDGKGPTAKNYIYEFAKHGLIWFSADQIEQIISGDYSLVWKEVNDELYTHGYQRVEPCKIDV